MQFFKSDDKTIYVPLELMRNKDLKTSDKLIITVIGNEESKYGICSLHNADIASRCNVSESTVTRSINKLIKKGYLKKVSFDGRNRVIKLTNLV